MNPRLEQLDLEILSALNRERQAEMRREAQTADALGGQPRDGRAVKALRRLIVVLCVLAPIALWMVRAAAAAAGGDGGDGFIHVMM